MPRQQVRKMNVLSAGIVGVFVHGLIGLVVVVLFSVLLVLAFAVVAGNPEILPFPVEEEQVRVLGLTLVGGAVTNLVTGVAQAAAGGFFTGVIVAWVYNALQNAFGGPRLEVDVVENEEDGYAGVPGGPPPTRNPLLPVAYRAVRIGVASSGQVAMVANGLYTAVVAAMLCLAFIPVQNLFAQYADQSPAVDFMVSIGPVGIFAFYLLLVAAGVLVGGLLNGMLFAVVYNWGQGRLPDKRLKVECYEEPVDHVTRPAYPG